MKKTKITISTHAYIGMHKNRKGWKNKSSIEIAQELREKAWYGK